MLNDLNDEQRLNFAFAGRHLKGIVHNINTPLSAVMGRSEMLNMRLSKIASTESGVDKAEMEKCLRDVALVIENSSRISDILKNAMQKSIRADNYDRHPVSISQVLQEDLTFYMADMQFKHNVEKHIDIDENVPSIMANYVDISNSFMEILDNALNAMKDTVDKKIFVSAGINREHIEVNVGDTGRGIEPQLRDVLMTVLQHEGRDVPDAYKGTGIKRVARLLAPYKPVYSIKSVSGSTEIRINFPVKTE